MNQQKCETAALSEERIQEIARTTRNPNRGQVERVLRVAAAEAYAAGRKDAETHRLTRLMEIIGRLAAAGSADAKSIAADARLVLGTSLPIARKS